VLFPAAYVHFIVAGKKAYSLTWALQYINLFMINTGYIILAGSALKVREIFGTKYIFSSHLIQFGFFSLMTYFTTDKCFAVIFRLHCSYFIFFFSTKFSFTVIQATYVLFRDDGLLKLPYCIAIAGLVCAMFAICIPHLSALGIWLGFSTVFSLIYIIISFLLSLKDGNNSCLKCLSPQISSG